MTDIAPLCQVCAQPIPRDVVTSYKAWRARKFCNMDCRGVWRESTRQRELVTHGWKATDGRADEVEFLLSCGESHRQVATRLGLQVGSLARWLARHGEDELARQFYLEAWRERVAS